MSDKEILKINNLNVEFPLFGGILQREVSHVHAVKNLNLTVNQGETIGIVGESGSGKSTLLRHLIGTFIPDGGTVKVQGEDRAMLDDEGMSKVRRQFGILFQSGALFNSMSIADNVALSLREHTDLEPA